MDIYIYTWWLIPLSKWVITPVISGLTLLIPFITGVITHLLSGMSHQVVHRKKTSGTRVCPVLLQGRLRIIDAFLQETGPEIQHRLKKQNCGGYKPQKSCEYKYIYIHIYKYIYPQLWP